MAFSSNNYEQLGFAGRLLSFNDREQKILENSWAGMFAEEIFPAIDETVFMPFYSQESGSPSNPVNVTVGALILQQLFDLNDDEFIEALICDIRFQYALHTTSRSHQPLSARSLRRFRKRCQDYKESTGEDIFHRCVTGFSVQLDAFLASYFEKGLDSAVIEKLIFKNREEDFDVRVLAGETPVEALAVPEEKENAKVLSGSWKFAYAVNYDNAVKGFEKTSFDCTFWDDIDVPAEFTIPKEKRPVFMDADCPWDGFEEVKSGKYPRRYNPVGSYVRSFAVSERMLEKKLFVEFDAAEGGIAVWVNGRYAGYCDGDKLPACFDITELASEGLNKLAVQSFKWTGRTKAGETDPAVLAGISGKVTLFNTGENAAAVNKGGETSPLRVVKGRRCAGVSAVGASGEKYEDILDLQTGMLKSCTKNGKEIFEKTPCLNFWNENNLTGKPDAAVLQWKSAGEYAYLSEGKEPSVRKHKDHVSAMLELVLPVLSENKCSLLYRFYTSGMIEISMEMEKKEGDSLPSEFEIQAKLLPESAVKIKNYYQEENKKLKYTMIIIR